MRRIGNLVALTTATFTAAIPAYAQDAPQELIANSGDTGWTMAAALVALLAIPGIALLYGNRKTDTAGGGAAQSLRTVFAAIAGVTLMWIAIGYSIAFSPTGGNWLGDSFNWMLNNLSTVRSDSSIAESAFVLFQLVLALVAGLIAIGAVAGRVNAGWATAFATLWSLLVYAPLAYWIWSDGWLANLGAVDGAGGIIVLISAGSSALIAAMISGQTNVHNDTVEDDDSFWPLIGSALIAVSFIAIIGGAEFGATDNAAIAMLNAFACASASALVWAGLASRFSHSGTIASGFLVGLAAAMASAGFVGPGGSIIIGIIAALISFFVTRIMAGRLGRANAIFSTLTVGAVVGALLLAIFRDPMFGGTGYPSGMTTIGQLVAQTITVAIAGLWSIIGSLIVGYSAAIIWKPEN